MNKLSKFIEGLYKILKEESVDEFHVKVFSSGLCQISFFPYSFNNKDVEKLNKLSTDWVIEEGRVIISIKNWGDEE